MFKHSFDTAGGSAVFPSELPGKLLIAKAEGKLDPVSQFKGLLALTQSTKETANIPFFRHPFAMDVQSEPLTFIDLRPYRNSLSQNAKGEVEFVNEGAAGILFRRAILEMNWEKGAMDGFFFNIDVPLAIFSKWIGGLLKSKLTLNDAVGEKVQALVAFYYYCLHTEKNQFDTRQRQVFTVKISRILNIPYQRLESWFEPLDYMANLEDLCVALAKYGNSLSLKRIDHRVIWGLVATSWFGGADVRELLTVSLEYPPTFIAMIYAACAGEKLYRKAFLSQLIEKEKGKIRSDEFVGRVNDMIRMSAGRE